jgi:hypothetical protein
MIKLTVLVKRNPALAVDEFHELWREHGRVIANEPALAQHVARYEQHHRLAVDYANGDTYDGMVLQWYESYRDFIAFIEEPKYAELIQPDEQRLLDMDSIVVLFTDEAETFIGD